MMTAVWVALAGALGSLARYGLASGVNRATGERFPYGTLTVNLIGSAAIGFVMAWFTARGAPDARARVILTAGFLGGFTTYSAFAYETLALVDQRAYLRAGVNVLGTLALCFAACAAGYALARRL